MKPLHVHFGEKRSTSFTFLSSCTLELKCKMLDGGWFKNLLLSSKVSVCESYCHYRLYAFLAVAIFSLGPHLRF